MTAKKLSLQRLRFLLVLSALALFIGLSFSDKSQAARQATTATNQLQPFKTTLRFAKAWTKQLQLQQGQTFDLSVAIPNPSQLPKHGRISVSWRLLSETPREFNGPNTRAWNEFGIYTKPTAAWRKVLHALDPDVFQTYRAPVSGTYQLEIAPVEEESTQFEGPRWREEGSVPNAVKFPSRTPWPSTLTLPITVAISPIDVTDSAKTGTYVEQEPNDTPEQAQSLVFESKADNDGVQSIRISGSADDIEYFDNAKVGQSGDDWFKIVFTGTEPRLLTADLAIPDQVLAAQLRFYAVPVQQDLQFDQIPDRLLPLKEYTEGRNENERVHQQNEGHRAAIVRLLKPGFVYYLRAEANAPGYEIELRLLQPAPYTNPQLAVRQAMYDHLGQVDSWLSNRPRGASVERRIRDTGNLMGTHCMSCHTHSGVWGPVVAVQNGYQLENIQHFRRLKNLMYESLRPTNYLKDAANNTSLAPLDVGDGPAGTRVAGHNVSTAEIVFPARKLHSTQIVRTANHVLQTADPSGINAAGPGSNVGQSVVYNYSGEILRRAWDRTNHPRYFAALEEKAEKMLAVTPRYSDDLSHRIEFFKRFFPQDYEAQNLKAQNLSKTVPPDPPPSVAPKSSDNNAPKEPPPAQFPAYQVLPTEKAKTLVQRIQAQLRSDEARLRAIQNPDGSWGFDPGKSGDQGKTWSTDRQFDPAPTALALIALHALGYDQSDPAIARGVQALLKAQDPYGRWNKNALTGFVTTAYSLHALSRLYPRTPPKIDRASFIAQSADTLSQRISKIRALSQAEQKDWVNLVLPSTSSPNAHIRRWSAIALGGVHQRSGLPALQKLMGDPVKMVRDAASWAVKQTLLDDAGFDVILASFQSADDLTRESIMKALGIRADAVMPTPDFQFTALTKVLDHGLNQDPAPAVRAWAAKAAWQWWIWNPPVRAALNQSWIKKLTAPESNALVENAFRYQSHALFIANGHKANGSEEHQYKELATLFKTLADKLEDDAVPSATRDLLAWRLVRIAATFYNTSGGDGGPGQMGYITPNSTELMGKAAYRLWNQINPTDLAAMRLILEGAANVAYQPLQDRIIDYSTQGPESLRNIAAAAVSDPSAVSLPATQEKVEPLVDQILRGAQDYDRRQTLAQPVIRLFSRAHWNVPKTVEQQELLYSLLIPKHSKAPTQKELDAMLQAAADAVKPMGLPDADWYVADRMGAMIAANTDLHTDVLLKYIPGMTTNPLTKHFWLPSVAWILEYGNGVPEIEPQPVTIPSHIADARKRAVQLYLQSLQSDTPEMTRYITMRLANMTALRQIPEIQAAWRQYLETSNNGAIRNALKNADEKVWLGDLQTAIKQEPLAKQLLDQQGQPLLTPAFVKNFRYFNDHVAPELNRNQRMDEMSCLKCHGVKGRVPSMELEPADGNGYWSMAKMLKNYLILQQRVNLAEIETSKLLRKPLNVQTGKEDGHQGGRRYTPNERAYQIIRRWVLDQPNVAQSYSTQTSTR